MAVRDPLVAAVYGHQVNMAANADAEAILGHRFARPDLLREALTHRSASTSGTRRTPAIASNERLEFIGDRVLGLLVAEWLAERFPDEQEGALGRRLALLVSQPVLAEIADAEGLSEVLTVSAGETRAGVRKLATVLADATEAMIGALYLDGGLVAARAFVRRAFLSAMEGQKRPPKDAKTALQEWAQRRGMKLPAYVVVTRDGPPHAPNFVISVTVAEKTAQGVAGTKRAAEMMAAVDLLGKLKT